ncbi:polysaccharide deacetylase family protein [Bacillus massilinigeriensis]|uniref:polysaccharide deacetylase family protein n=1 Tax=Bacillus massilionigeriensis TaxID=1805475 RepID=UPI00096B6510|nr:polysaccharide deacetylase family protein [Bacillus massilionigeriensis]
MKKLITIIALAFISYGIVSNPISEGYLRSLNRDAVPVIKSSNDISLYDEIEQKASEYNIKPIDAKIDPIWKAIPGLNGFEVDVKASYKKMKGERKFDEEKLIFKEVKPKIHLTDLPPNPIYKGNPNKPMVAFIINVAWGNEYLSEILSILKKHNVRASFFLEGRWTKNNPELAKMIVSAGHEVGNHSFTHPDMKRLTSSRIQEEIQRTNDVIMATTDVTPKWFAPPSGSFRDEVVKIAANNHLGTVMWSVDTIDWQKPEPEVLIERVLGKIHNGALILMHPTESTTKALDRLIIGIKEKNLEMNTVSETLSENNLKR